jgi:capsular exopolysaccharide synthesis family protein
MPFDNLASAAMHDRVEASTTRPDPVVEFVRRKSPVPSSDSSDDHEQLSSQGITEREFAQLQITDLPRVLLPRDISKPLVTSNGRSAKAALEAYRSLRTRLLKSQASKGFRAIAVASVGRSEGKTLTAFNLACCCAQVENLSVLLIDGDLRRRSLTNLIGGLPAVGLADVMGGSACCAEAVVRTDVPNLFVMGAGSSEVPPSELFSTGKWGQVIRWSRNHFKIVLVDALSVGASADFELIAPECDGILLLVRARNTQREALKMAIEQLDASKLIGIVWNGGTSGKEDLC